MSVAHRSIARLPLEIFENLSACSFKGEESSLDPEELRAAIVRQLKSVATNKRFRKVYLHISTVGPFLQLSPQTLLSALDPLLTYGTPARQSTSLLSPESFYGFSDSTFCL